MKKLLIVIFSIFFVFTLSSCVVEEPETIDDPIDENENNEDPVDDPDPLVEVSIELDLLFNEYTDAELTFYVESNAVIGTNITNIYVGMDETENTEVYAIRSQYMGRWDSVNYIIIIDVETETLLGVEIMYHNEQRGAFIELDSFLNQFVDMDINHYINEDVILGIDGDASATTTISGFDDTLDSAIDYYLNNLK